MSKMKLSQKIRPTKFLVRALEKLFYFESKNAAQKQPEHTHHWFSVLCLTGVDYFSTLAYQPSIALLAVGIMAPFASLLLVLVTLFGAVPTYIEVSKRSFTGQGSIAMLEHLVSGWKGKIAVLALLAFALTDFFITITLSASDAAIHITENPLVNPWLAGYELPIALALVVVLGFIFYIGIREVITVAMFTVIPFLVVTAIILGRAMMEISQNPIHWDRWLMNPMWNNDYAALAVLVILVFPKLALGLSGFETGVSVMPLIHNKEHKKLSAKKNMPLSRIAGTKKLLITAAVIMSFYLLASSWTISLLLDRTDVQEGGPAAGRAISYLAHTYLGHGMGTVYDVLTITILWFAGASAMAALLSLIPRYFPRFGMAPQWIALPRLLVAILTAISLLIIYLFNASVTHQASAYATGVLALILSAAVAVFLSLRKERKDVRPQQQRGHLYKTIYFGLVTAVFIFVFIDNIVGRPEGILIASIFFAVIVVTSSISRWWRTSELRVTSHEFVDEKSQELFESLRGKKIDLVPIQPGNLDWFRHKEDKIKRYYKETRQFAFISVRLRDDRSEFMAPLTIKVAPIDGSNSFHIKVSGAVAIPNTVAYISEQLDPVSIYLGLARKNPMEQAISYVFFGEGEIGMLTYKVLVQYWETHPHEVHTRPNIFLMSE
jgi:hypothetical protein